VGNEGLDQLGFPRVWKVFEMKLFTTTTRPFVEVISLVLLLAMSLHADTVTLKNGAKIDGMVTGRHEGYVILSIGNVGTMKLLETEIAKIEKNARTGYLDPERSGKKAKQLPKVGGDSKKAEEAGKKKESDTKKGAVGKVVELSPEQSKRIKTLANELTKQKTTKRTRAERQLLAFGDAALPEVIKLSKHPFMRTRAAVFRILKASRDFQIVQPCLEGLRDENEFVRKLAWEAIKNVSKKRYSFPWDSKSAIKRQKAIAKWEKWVEREEQQRREAAEKLKKDSSTVGEKKSRSERPQPSD